MGRYCQTGPRWGILSGNAVIANWLSSDESSVSLHVMTGGRCIAAVILTCFGCWAGFAQQTTITHREAESLVRMVLRHERVHLPSQYCEVENLDRNGASFIDDYYSFGPYCAYPGAAAITPFAIYVVSPRTGDVWKFEACDHFNFPELRRLQREIMRRTHATAAEEADYSFVHGCSRSNNDSAQSQWLSVRGTYRNPALGYSIKVPPGLKGTTGDQAGPERGLRISLTSGGNVAIWGEPNSFEWKTPAAGIRYALDAEKCAAPQEGVSSARVGKLSEAAGTLVCGNSIVDTLLAFREGGGPIYWLRLETTQESRVQDEAVLGRIAASFELIPWQ